MKARQFLNVVLQRYGRGSLYTVSRIKPDEHLFYPSTAQAQAAAKSKLGMDWPSSAVVPPWMETISRMPPPRLRFEQSVSDDKRLDFLPFYERGSGGDSNIFCVDAAGHTVLYDIEAGSIQTLPCLNSPKGSRPIGFSTTDPDAPDPERADVFYVMDRFPVSCNPCNFEALMYSDPSNGGRLKGWHWHELPPPPAHVDNCIVNCHALLDIDGDSILAVSSTEKSVGTYCFNTVSSKWFKAGSWTLPFHTRAEHVPELENLLFGISIDRPNHFCAMDISSLRTERVPPLVYSWPELDLPEDWLMLDCSFVYLGDGRFCITKVFEFGLDEDTGDLTEMGAVMSGVEVLHHEKSGLVMVKHRSKFYNFIRDDIQCVL
ncbi:unnamed protein product [Triticum aestivum]|uniref:Uncharacterized protein n=1 Tax=Triticum aestivum TaxID=4565 RepID=A0A7H4LPC5_WHEAT|nr:unnamed protein product [Triticum aestivum]